MGARRTSPLGALFVNPTYREKLTAFLVLGGIGGLFFGYQAWRYFFVEGITTEERKNLLLFAASMGLWWGLDRVFDLEKQIGQLESQAAEQVGFR